MGGGTTFQQREKKRREKKRPRAPSSSADRTRKRRMRNRISAQRHRDRQKAYLAELVESVERLQNENDELKLRARELQESRNSLARQLEGVLKSPAGGKGLPLPQSPATTGSSPSSDGLPFDDHLEAIMQLLEGQKCMSSPTFSSSDPECKGTAELWQKWTDPFPFPVDKFEVQ